MDMRCERVGGNVRVCSQMLYRDGLALNTTFITGQKILQAFISHSCLKNGGKAGYCGKEEERDARDD